MTEKTFLTVRDVAKRWKISEKRVYQLKDDLEDPISHHRFGRNIRFDLKDIEAYERSHKLPKEDEDR